MKRIFYGPVAGSFLLVNSASAGAPGLVDGNGHPVAFVTSSQLQKEWNAYVKVKEGRLHLHAVQRQIRSRRNPLR
jgi:hypothetical protein